jgi:hypothetical protein
LLPAARRECLETLREAARKAVGEDAYLPGWISDRSDAINDAASELEWEREFSSGEISLLKEKELLDVAIDSLYRCGVLSLIMEMDAVRAPLEELDAWELAREAHKTAQWCGCCGRELAVKESAYFGVDVYIGMWPLYWDQVSKPKICKPHYERTVLCGSCTPEWLSPDRDDVVTQLCANCERPMVERLNLSRLQRTFCSDRCRHEYHNQLRKETRAEEHKMVCEVCGEEFTAKRRDAKFCSKACKQKAYRGRKDEG